MGGAATNITVELTWLLGILIALIFGSYGWTTVIAAYLYRMLNEFKNNHLEHINERLAKLENKEDD